MRGIDRVDQGTLLASFRPQAPFPAAALVDFFPKPFAAYRRVLNPARGVSGEVKPWAALASKDLVLLDSSTQWSDLGSSRSDYGSLDPTMGAIDNEVASVLQEILARHTTTPEEVFFLVWEGYSDVSAQYRLSSTVVAPYDRKMHVLVGSLADATSGEAASPLGAPLWWIPADGSWCVGNDIYARSVFVAGTTECLSEIGQDVRLESYPADSRTLVVPEDF